MARSMSFERFRFSTAPTDRLGRPTARGVDRGPASTHLSKRRAPASVFASHGLSSSPAETKRSRGGGTPRAGRRAADPTHGVKGRTGSDEEGIHGATRKEGVMRGGGERKSGEGDGGTWEGEVREEPFIAPAPAKWRERYARVCDECEAGRVPCRHHPERPLRLLVIGHNPSNHSWESGFSYSNPSNNFWKLLVTGSLVPEDWTAADCPRLPGELGIGFTDAGTEPGNDANKYPRAVMRAWRDDLYARLRGHLCRAVCHDFTADVADVDERPAAAPTTPAAPTGSNDPAVTGSDPATAPLAPSRQAAAAAAAAVAAAVRGYGPKIVAFAGKRQYSHLFDRLPSSVATGRQPIDSLPPGWPFDPDTTEVWVLPSSSGRAAMTREAREGPYVALGARLATEGWPRDVGSDGELVEDGGGE